VSPAETQAQQLARFATRVPTLQKLLAAGAVPGKPIKLTPSRPRVPGVGELSFHHPFHVFYNGVSFGQQDRMDVDQHPGSSVNLVLSLSGDFKYLLRFRCACQARHCEFRLFRGPGQSGASTLVATASPIGNDTNTDVLSIVTPPAMNASGRSIAVHAPAPFGARLLFWREPLVVIGSEQSNRDALTPAPGFPSFAIALRKYTGRILLDALGELILISPRGSRNAKTG